MIDPAQKELVSEIGRDLIRQLAPEEMPLYRANSEAYFEDPEGALSGQQGKDEMLGFGAGQVVSLLTPIVLSVAVEVVRFVTAHAKESLKEEGASLIQDTVKRMFNK